MWHISLLFHHNPKVGNDNLIKKYTNLIKRKKSSKCWLMCRKALAKESRPGHLDFFFDCLPKVVLGLIWVFNCNYMLLYAGYFVGIHSFVRIVARRIILQYLQLFPLLIFDVLFKKCSIPNFPSPVDVRPD